MQWADLEEKQKQDIHEYYVSKIKDLQQQLTKAREQLVYLKRENGKLKFNNQVYEQAKKQFLNELTP